MKWKQYALVVLLSAVVFYANLGGYSISILDEAKNSTCAMEMREAGQPFLPTFNGELRTDKPPLHYYLMGTAYSWFGYTPFAARFFSAMMGVLTILLTFFITDRLLNNKTAWITTIILLASIHLSLQFQLAVPDPYLIFLVDVGLFGFAMFASTSRKRYLYIMYVALALAVLAKGPVAVGLPGIIFLTYLIITKQLNWYYLKSLAIPQGVVITLLIVLPIYYQLHIQSGGAWTEGFFFKHNLSRFSDTMEGHGGGLFYMPLVLAFGLLPFSFWLPQSFKLAWIERKQPLLLLSLIAVAAYIIFFTISRTKLPNYPVPCYPFGAILLANYLHKVDFNSRWFKVSLIALVAVLLVLPGGVKLGLEADPDFTAHRQLWWWFILLPLGGAMTFFLYRRNLIMALAAMAISFGLFNQVIHYVVLPRLDKELPTVDGLSVLESTSSLRYFEALNPAIPFAVAQVVPKMDSSAISDYLQLDPANLLITNDRHIKRLEEIPRLEVRYAAKDPFEKRTWYFLGAAFQDE